MLFGGSQGAVYINDFVLKVAPNLNEMGIKIIHQTGKMILKELKMNIKIKYSSRCFWFSKKFHQKMSKLILQ